MKIKLILKGILFYITFIYTILYLCAIDSITTMGFNYLIESSVVLLLLLLCCYNFINLNDIEKLTFYKWFDKILNP